MDKEEFMKKLEELCKAIEGGERVKNNSCKFRTCYNTIRISYFSWYG